VGTTTAWRYVTETVALLAARAPKLRQAVRAAKKAGLPFVVLDGTLARTNRVAADQPFFSGKHHCHGMNLQVLAGSAGQLLWVPGALPGSVNDMKAAWIWGIERELADGGLPAAWTTTSMPPNAAIVSAKSRFTSSSSTMSARMATASPLSARIASTAD
jgi:hypothetical protein